MPNFALIAEGKTDLWIIENIICGVFNGDEDQFSVNDLIPNRDETDLSREENPSNWGKVLKYCESPAFKGALNYNDYIIVQIDTDTSDEVNYDVPKFENGRELTPAELIERVKEKIRKLIGEEFFDENQSKIIFAISVHSIECWLIPLYCNNSLNRTKNCLDHLNKCLNQKNKNTIGDDKKPTYYDTLSKDYRKRKNLKGLYKKNPSLEIFVETLFSLPEVSTAEE